MPVLETLPPVEKQAMMSEPSTEKCLCEKAKGWLEESIHNPINYHPDEVSDYGSRALRDVGDDERYYEDVKSRCECRKRKVDGKSASIAVAGKFGMGDLAGDAKPAKKRCVTNPSTSSSSTTQVELVVNPNEEAKAKLVEIEADGFTPIENGVSVRQFNVNGEMFHEGKVVGAKIDKKTKMMTHFIYS